MTNHRDSDSYTIGVLNSLSGVMASSETLVADATRLAVQEINQAGGVLGREIRTAVRDGGSRASQFIAQARELTDKGVQVLFGCWTSASRKALLPVLQAANGLLFYPVQYEGLEESPHVIYTGSTLNQQVEPALDWVMDQGWRRMAIVGSDYVYPRTANTLMHGILEKRGGQVAQEMYLPLEGYATRPIVQQLLAACPDVILSTINGAANASFFRDLAELGPGSERLPVVSFSFAETELAEVPEAVGHYAAWDYFSTCNTEINGRFLERMREYVGCECPVSSPMANAYTQVYLWKAMVEAAGSFEVDALRKYQLVMVHGPSGVMELRQNRHVRKQAMVGRARSQGEFEIVWQYPEMIDPEPWFGVQTLLRGRVIQQALEAFPAVVDLHATLRRDKELQEELIRQLNIKQKELEAARDAAEAADRAKSDFLAAMSHEIRTPMNGVLGMAQLLRDSPLTPSQAEQVEIILSSGETLLAILNDILDFSKIKAGRIELEQVAFSLHDQLCETLHILAPKAHARGMEIELDIDLAMPDVRRGDPTRLRQVVLNLVSNAIKFTENGSIIVVVRSLPGDGEFVLLQVKDTGIGISREQQQRLFQPFVQADSGTTRKYGGTGLGLVISRRLVELFGGEMTLESELGRGTTFSMKLPLPLAGQADIPATGRQVFPPRNVLTGLRVLIVDDNAVNLRIARGLLEGLGVVADAAASAEHAQLLLEDRCQDGLSGYDGLLIDAMMPVTDGYALAHWVRAQPWGKTVPLVLASSAIGESRERWEGEQSLFAAVLAKPLRRVTLARTLAATLSKWRPEAAPRGTTAARSRRVLVAEDSLVNQKVILTLLQRQGHQVTVVDNGQAALDHLERPDVCDLILMDVQMPVLDGLEATRLIRLRESDRGWSRLPIIALTGNAMEEDQEACQAAGMDRCLIKPVNMQDILAIVAATPLRSESSPPSILVSASQQSGGG